MLIATLGHRGDPAFAGFFSKDEILWQTWTSEHGAYIWLWLVGYVTALMTAFYMFRLMYLTFYGHSRMSHEVEHHIHESPKSMTVPLIDSGVLLDLCGLARMAAQPGAAPTASRNFSSRCSLAKEQCCRRKARPASWPQAKRKKSTPAGTEYGLMFLSVAAASRRMGNGVEILSHTPTRDTRADGRRSSAALHRSLQQVVCRRSSTTTLHRPPQSRERPSRRAGAGRASAWFDVHVVDGAVNGAGWSTRIARSISKWLDTWIIDGIGVNGPAILARILSYPVRLFEWGLVQWYALVMVAGLLGFVFYYVVSRAESEPSC